MRKIIGLACCLVIILTGMGRSYSVVQDKVGLTEAEREYISQRGVVRMVIDPDWYPYERLVDEKTNEGISAELIALIGERTGLKFEIVPTKSWDESIKLAKLGKADVLSFLNQTDERSQWLLFTEPYFVDPNVLITRDEHDYVTNLGRLTDETLVLPVGTSIEERVRKDFPNLKIILVESEEEAINFVDEKKANMTLRSLSMAAFVINNGGYFNLKIAGEVPNYTNQLRMGITNGDRVLKEILNKGIATITDQEVQRAMNQHISINVVKGFDYKLFGVIFSLFSIVLLISFWVLSRIQRLNKRLKQRQDELIILSEKLTHSEAEYRKITGELESKNNLLQKVASIDALSGLQNRYAFNQRITEEIERANRYGSELSLLMIDLDRFKRINDTYGHNAGDEVIIKVSEALQSVIRKVDLIARWGGEEFIVLLPGIGLNDALLVGEKLRQKAASILYFEKESVTISIGVSTWTPSDIMESWINRTDKALYHAKQEGRNRVCASESSDIYMKALLAWDPSWDSGNLAIDQQHRELLIECNDLIALILQNASQSTILEKLKNVLKHISTHFKYEESILNQLNYKDLSLHSQSHNLLLEKAAILLKKSMDGKLLPSDVVHFVVGDVVTNHLIQEDTKFFELFK